MTAYMARSMRRRGSSTHGMKLPLRSLGIFSSRSLARDTLYRCWVLLAGFEKGT